MLFAGLYSHQELIFFFFNDTATTEIYTLSLHDALPISRAVEPRAVPDVGDVEIPEPLVCVDLDDHVRLDRKSTRLNSSHLVISYAVFCLKKKKNSHCCWVRLCRPVSTLPSASTTYS